MKTFKSYLSETAYGMFANYLGSSVMPHLQSRTRELEFRTDQLEKALALAHARGADGVRTEIGVPFGDAIEGSVEFRPRVRGNASRIVFHFNPNGTVRIVADRNVAARAAALRDLGPLMARIFGGGFR